MAVMGRPTKRNEATARVVVAAVKTGHSLARAAELAGVGRGTLLRWLRRGRAGEPQYRAFARRVDQARADRRAAEAAQWPDGTDWPGTPAEGGLSTLPAGG